MKLIDLSVTINHNNPSDPPGQRAYFDYMTHEQGADSMITFFPAATKEDLPNGLGWAFESMKIATHTGTHMDAPYHFHPTAEGKPAKTIEEMPLEWCFGDGVMLDFSDRPTGTLIMAKDIQDKLQEIGYTIKPFDIVFIRSGAAPYYGTPEYLVQGCGMGRDATLWLLEQGVKIVGTDAWSWDCPLPLVAKRFETCRDKSIIWEGHFAGIEKEYFQIEKLANLEKLPPFGFKVCCIPIKLDKASAGWVRPVAFLED